jgi:transposase
VDHIADMERQVIRLLDMLFTENERPFHIAKHNRNRGPERAEALKQAAQSSFRIDIALDAYRILIAYARLTNPFF